MCFHLWSSGYHRCITLIFVFWFVVWVYLMGYQNGTTLAVILATTTIWVYHIIFVGSFYDVASISSAGMRCLLHASFLLFECWVLSSHDIECTKWAVSWNIQIVWLIYCLEHIFAVQKCNFKQTSGVCWCLPSWSWYCRHFSMSKNFTGKIHWNSQWQPLWWKHTKNTHCCQINSP